MPDADGAIINGGGVAGFTAGIALRRAGIDATIFEQSSEVREIGSGLGIQYAAMKALRQIGLFDDVREMGEPLVRMEMGTSNGKPLVTIPHTEISEKLGVQTVNVHRGEFLGLLVREFGRDRVVVGARCVGFEEDETGVTARFADGRTARGAMLVGADGARSTIREHALGAGDPRATDIVVWRAMPDFEHPAAPLGVLRQAFGRGKIFSMVPGTRGRVFWFAIGLVSDFGAEPATDQKQELLDAFGHWPEPIRELLEATDEREITRTRIYDRPPARRWGTARVTLAGDAAHPMVPTLGQGASQGIEDGVALAKHLSGAGTLADATALRSALEAYEADRIARTTPLVVNARRFARVALGKNPVTAGLRNLVLRATPAASWQRRLWAQHSHEV